MKDLIYSAPLLEGCYDDQTEVLTEDGWKFFKNCSNEDLFCTLNPNTFNIEYRKALKFFEYKYSGKMYVYHSSRNSIDLCVTPTHNMFIGRYNEDKHHFTWSLSPVDTIINRNFHFCKTGNWSGEYQEYFILPACQDGNNKYLPEVKIKMEEWLEFFGYYLSEGSCTHTAKSTGYIISIKQTKDQEKKIMLAAVKKIAKYVNSKVFSTSNIYLYNFQLYQYLKQFGKCNDKFIPKDILKLDKKQLNILYNSLMLGDGCSGYVCGDTYYTSSVKLKDNFLELLLKIGFGGSAKIKNCAGTKIKFKNRYITSTFDNWVINIRKHSLYPKRNIEPGYLKKHETQMDGFIDYKGYVYCVTVENHTLFIRRNGKTVWCGNSGFGTAARGYVYWLQQLTDIDMKLDFVYYTMSNPLDYLSQDEIDYFSQYAHTVGLDSKKYKNSIYLNHISPDISYTRPNFGHNILMSIWETDRIPETAVEKCNNFDLIITASEFSKFAFLNAGVKKQVEVVPHIITPYTDVIPINENISKLVEDKFVFLSVFEWHIGKGYDVLINGFINAFKDRDDVILILKVNSFTDATLLKQIVSDYIKKVKGDLKYPMVVPICTPISRNNLMFLYSIANCYVSTSRREGFSLTLADAIVNKVPCIAPNHGGHIEFLNDDNSVLIPSIFSEIHHLEKERLNYKGQRWIEMDYNIFIEALKAMEQEWRNPDPDLLSNFNKEVDKVRQHLSPETNINKLIQIFNI